MTDLRAAAQQALEVLEAGPDVDPIFAGETEVALRAALEQPEQAEPVARVLQTVGQYPTGRFVAEVETVRRLRNGESLYTHPPRREWRGLTEEEIKALSNDCYDGGHTNPMILFARAIEAALRSKNHD